MGLLGFTLFSSSASAQVFDPGPSDPALFSNVINLPPDPDLGDFTTLLGTQVNVSDGGAIGSNFFADFGTEVNISGGTVGDVFNASSDSEVNISGGTVGDFFFVNGEVSISGGTVGSGFADFLSGDVELIGGEFQVDGVPVVGTTFDLVTDNVTFTGTLADGSTFIFSSVNDLLTEVTLTPAVLPALDLSPIVVSTSDPNLPSGLRSGQTLTLSDGGELGANFEVVGATFNVEGGVLVK